MKFIKDKNYLDYIRKNYTDIRIFAHYLNISDQDIHKCINNGNKVHNTIRGEINPSLGFTYNGKKLYAYDYGNNYYRGDFIDFAGFALNLNPNLPVEFIQICKDIINNVNESSSLDITRSKRIARKRVKEFFRIDVNFKNFTPKEIDYWNDYLLDIQLIRNEKVYSVRSAYKTDISGRRTKIYNYRSNDICFAYKDIVYNDVQIWKLYFPYRKKDRIRFYTNNKFPIESIWDIKVKSEIAIITKSKKDTMVIKNIPIVQYEDENNSISYYTLSSETSRIKKDSKLGKLLNAHPIKIVHADYDKAGKMCAKYYRDVFNAIPMLTEDRKYKDISDLIKKYGIENINKHLEYEIDYIK